MVGTEVGEGREPAPQVPLRPQVDLRDAANRLADFLNILLAVDYDIDVIDRLAKSRKKDEFAEAVYNALRRRENLESKIIELEGENEVKDRAVKRLRRVNERDIELLLLELDEKEIKKWASYIGARALAYNDTFGRLRSLLEKRG